MSIRLQSPPRLSAAGFGGRIPIVCIFFILAFASLLPVMLFVAADVRQIPFYMLTRDVATLGALPAWAGLLSMLGLFGWTAACAVALFTAVFFWYFADRPNRPIALFAGAGGLSLLMLLDDAFLLHERYFPKLLGISEEIIYYGYGVLGLFWLIFTRSSILQTPWVLLLIAGGSFAASVVTDLVTAHAIDGVLLLVEDGAKWLGIVAWLLYIITSALNLLALQLPSRMDGQHLPAEGTEQNDIVGEPCQAAASSEKGDR